MIDLQGYQNINAYIQKKGGLKDSLLNKVFRSEWEASWERMTPQDYETFDREIVNGKEVFEAIVTPGYIMVCRAHCAKIIPVRNILWMFAKVGVQKMYFIPYNKTHSVILLDRYGEWETLGFVNTGGFSKKAPADDACQLIKSIIGQTRPGIVYGYSPELDEMASENLAGFIEMVDSRS